MIEDESLGDKEEILNEGEPVHKDRSLLYMGLILGFVILIMGYLALFVDDPSKLFSKQEKIQLAVEDKGSLLNESQSMNDEQVRTSLIKFIEAFYYDQRRGYFDPPSYFADITETFYNYHNLTHKRLKEIYWKRLEAMDNFSRNWIVSSLEYNRRDSRITATYWAQESYFRNALKERYSALIKYEIVINEMGKIVSLREADVKNEEVQKLQPDSMALTQSVPTQTEADPSLPAADNKVVDLSLVEVVPEFVGGQKEFAKYLAANIKYPPTAKQNSVQGKVYLSFIVEKDGQLTDIKVKQGLGSDCDEEAIRLLRSSPKWKPGMIKESPVRTYFVLPVVFQL